jgi:hypothetical protein
MLRFARCFIHRQLLQLASTDAQGIFNGTVEPMNCFLRMAHRSQLFKVRLLTSSPTYLEVFNSVSLCLCGKIQSCRVDSSQRAFEVFDGPVVAG